MGMTHRFAATLLILAGLAGPDAPPADADGSTVARTTDAVAKELADEFEELVKSKKPKLKDGERKLEILRELERAPCETAQRFLLGLVKKKSTEGDHRLYAMRALLKMADTKALDTVVSSLQKAKDPTLWQAFGEMLSAGPSDDVRAWWTSKGWPARTSTCAAHASTRWRWRRWKQQAMPSAASTSGRPAARMAGSWPTGRSARWCGARGPMRAPCCSRPRAMRSGRFDWRRPSSSLPRSPSTPSPKRRCADCCRTRTPG